MTYGSSLQNYSPASRAQHSIFRQGRLSGGLSPARLEVLIRAKLRLAPRKSRVFSVNTSSPKLKLTNTVSRVHLPSRPAILAPKRGNNFRILPKGQSGRRAFSTGGFIGSTPLICHFVSAPATSAEHQRDLGYGRPRHRDEAARGVGLGGGSGHPSTVLVEVMHVAVPR